MVMASALPEDFESWLSDRLRALNTDDEVYRPYIVSILEDEPDSEERKEALDGVLGGVSEDEAKMEGFRDDILSRWQRREAALKGAQGASDAKSASEKVDLNQKLASITDSKTTAYKEAKEKASGTEPDRAVKEAILAQYAGVVEESSEDEDDGDDKGGKGGVDPLLANSNAEAVAAAEAEKREKGRLAAAAKKEKDKEDREKQKKQQEDRKKKAQEKAAKGERRR